MRIRNILMKDLFKYLNDTFSYPFQTESAAFNKLKQYSQKMCVF